MLGRLINTARRWLGRSDTPPSPPQPLRCRPGDTARITRGTNRDRLVHIDCADHDRLGWWQVTAMQSMVGFTEPGGKLGMLRSAGTVMHGPDHVLQPLRDSDGEDEMLRIAGKPVSAPVSPARPVTVED